MKTSHAVIKAWTPLIASSILTLLTAMTPAAAVADTLNLVDIIQGDGSRGFSAPGYSVSKAGDVNGDGVADFLVGVPVCNFQAPCLYVVFGRRGGLPPRIDATYLQALDGSNGFKIAGVVPLDERFMAAAGDVNGDGVDDVIVSDRYMGGSAYVVFGSRSGFPALIDARQLDGMNGFAIRREVGQAIGSPVHGVGDINGDGVADVAVETEAYFASTQPPNLYLRKGYVVFGRRGWSEASIDLASLDGRNGFRVVAPGVSIDDSAVRLAAAGDFNGDGVPDLIVGAPGSEKVRRYPPLALPTGQAHVVFGTRSAFPAVLVVPDDFGATVHGFTLNGTPNGMLGTSVGAAGDVNGDGVADIIVNGVYNAPVVVFGSRSGLPVSLDITSLDGANGFELSLGPAFAGTTSSGVGDLNNDGLADVVVTTRQLPATGGGSAYVRYGRSAPLPASIDVMNPASNEGYIVLGLSPSSTDPGAGIGSSAAIGDVDGSGVDDIVVNLGGFAARGGIVIYGNGPPPQLSALITRKTGLQDARVWTLTLTNSGDGAAKGAELTALGLTQTFGAACVPRRVQPLSLPLAVGAVAPQACASGEVKIDFTGCAASARFSATIGFRSNGGLFTGQKTLNNQFR